MKKFYTVCGFPRCGNTLLTSYSKSKSRYSLYRYFIFTWRCLICMVLMTGEAESYLSSPSPENLHSLFQNTFESYYAHREEKYIIERSTWMTPFSFPLYSRDYCPNEIKMVILVRPLKDIVKSCLNVCKNSPGFYINQEYLQIDSTTLYKTELEDQSRYNF